MSPPFRGKPSCAGIIFQLFLSLNKEIWQGFLTAKTGPSLCRGPSSKPKLQPPDTSHAVSGPHKDTGPTAPRHTDLVSEPCLQGLLRQHPVQGAVGGWCSGSCCLCGGTNIPDPRVPRELTSSQTERRTDRQTSWLRHALIRAMDSEVVSQPNRARAPLLAPPHPTFTQRPLCSYFTSTPRIFIKKQFSRTF